MRMVCYCMCMVFGSVCVSACVRYVSCMCKVFGGVLVHVYGVIVHLCVC